MLITDSDSLADFCSALRDAPYVAVDTEFMREKSYYPRLCLVQLAHGEHFAAIDPLAEGLDMAPLSDLLSDPDQIKVFHAAAGDLEIFLQKTGRVPAPVFDTQIAAAVCGHGEQPGYGTLAANLLGITIDKVSQATDWSLRPLTERQVDYALGDVTHLCAIYEALRDELESSGRSAWVAEEMAALLDPSRYETDPRLAWRRIRVRRPTRLVLAVLRELAEWRELTAMERDIPRPWVAKDEALVEIAQHQPTNLTELKRVRAMSAQVAQRDGAALLDAVARTLASSEETWPELPERREPLSGHESLVALLQALLRLRCETHGVAMWLVARREDLNRIATEDEPDVPALHGWRREIFGEAALALRDGRLGLTGDGRGVVDVAVATTSAARTLSARRRRSRPDSGSTPAPER